MWKVSKRMEVAGAHSLSLDYESKCTTKHGHNWIITVHCAAVKLNHNGMVVDFTEIKKKIHDVLDHTDLNRIFPKMNPTAENIAKWVFEQFDTCYKVEVQESEGNIAIYEDEMFFYKNFTNEKV